MGWEHWARADTLSLPECKQLHGGDFHSQHTGLSSEHLPWSHPYSAKVIRLNSIMQGKKRNRQRSPEAWQHATGEKGTAKQQQWHTGPRWCTSKRGGQDMAAVISCNLISWYQVRHRNMELRNEAKERHQHQEMSLWATLEARWGAWTPRSRSKEKPRHRLSPLPWALLRKSQWGRT